MRNVLEGVPKSLPAIVKAFRIQEKARGIGFEWETKTQIWDKVLEEIEELKKEMKNGDPDRIESEFGDVLFALINYARFIAVNHRVICHNVVYRADISQNVLCRESVSVEERCVFGQIASTTEKE